MNSQVNNKRHNISSIQTSVIKYYRRKHSLKNCLSLPFLWLVALFLWGLDSSSFFMAKHFLSFFILHSPNSAITHTHTHLSSRTLTLICHHAHSHSSAITHTHTHLPSRTLTLICHHAHSHSSAITHTHTPCHPQMSWGDPEQMKGH